MDKLKIYEAWVFIKERNREYLYTITAPNIDDAQQSVSKLAVMEHCPDATDVFVKIRETTREQIDETIAAHGRAQ